MSIEQVFCTVPWFEVHINADGTYHSCGAQPNPKKIAVYDGFLDTHNVFNMTIEQWINSEYQKQVRLNKLQGQADMRCNICYNEERSNCSSKRERENLKSNIDPQNFTVTFSHSWHRQFFDYSLKNQGLSSILWPNSYHISLGNECNFACRMCGPFASSRLAAEEQSAGRYQGPIRQNWTENQQAWNMVVEHMCATPDLKFLHIIGGEPLLNPRFHELLDRLISADKTDMYVGFTTNGSIIDDGVIDKLNQFQHVEIGISVECMGPINDIIRKGSKLPKILTNIEWYLKFRDPDRVYVVLRPTPSALSVHGLDDLYRWCIDRQLDVMSQILAYPEYQQIRQLPQSIKQRLLDQYSTWQFQEPLPGTSDPRDPTRFREHIDNEIRAVISHLNQPNEPVLTELLYKNLHDWGWFDDPQIKNYFI